MILSRSHRDLLTAAIGVSALFALAFGRGWTKEAPGHAGQTDLRVAYFPNLTHAPALIGMAKGIFQRDLPNYHISERVVNAGPDAMEALLAGEVDMAFVGPSPATNTFLQSKGQALRIVAGVCQGGASLVAREDLPIGGIRDLDGRRIAVPQLGGTQDVSCRHFLAVNGLKTTDHGGTVTILPVANPDIQTLFLRKQIDAAWVPEPWASRLVADAHAKTVLDERTLWPGGKFTTTVLVARKGFANAHPDAVRAFVQSHLRTVEWIHRNPAEAETVANGELKRLTGKPLKPAILAQAWSHLSFSGDPGSASVLAFANAAFDEGYLKSSPGRLEGLIDSRDLVATLGERR